MIVRYAAPSLVLVAGVPGAGKSSLLDRAAPDNAEVIVADEVRGYLQALRGFDYHAYEESVIDDARHEFFNDMQAAMNEGVNVLAEAAYLSSKSRQEMIDFAAMNGYETHLLVVRATWEECCDGMEGRERRVPLDKLGGYFQMWRKLEAQIEAGTFDAGLQTILVVGRDELDTITSIDFEP